VGFCQVQQVIRSQEAFRKLIAVNVPIQLLLSFGYVLNQPESHGYYNMDTTQHYLRVSGPGVELESWSESQFGCPSDRVLARRVTLELPCPRDEELVGHAPVIPPNDDFVLHVVVFPAVVGILHNLESPTLVTSEAYLNSAPYENVDSSQLLFIRNWVVATHLVGWLPDP